MWVSAFAFSGSCSLTAGVDFPQQHRERTAEQPVWALSPPKDRPATTGVCSPHRDTGAVVAPSETFLLGAVPTRISHSDSRAL